MDVKEGMGLMVKDNHRNNVVAKGASRMRK